MPDEQLIDAKVRAVIEPLFPKVYAGQRRHQARNFASSAASAAVTIGWVD